MGLILRALEMALNRVYPSPWGDEQDRWAGADDTWPAENMTPDVPTITDSRSQPDLIITRQYGLRMPNGDIVWNAWSTPPLFIPFDNALDRLRMVANLQKTASDVGFEPEEFLGRYGWATRNQLASVVYEDTATYSLTDPELCGANASPGEKGKENGN